MRHRQRLVAFAVLAFAACEIGLTLPAGAGLVREKPGSRRALLIAAGSSDAAARAEELAEVLASTYGFLPENAVKLYDEQATSKLVYLAVADLQESVQPGDTLFVYVDLPLSERATRTLSSALWVPSDGQVESPHTLLSPADLQSSLYQIRRAEIFFVVNGCVELTPSRSLKGGFAASIVHSLTVCGPRLDHPAFSTALISALRSGLGEEAMDQFTGSELADYLQGTLPEWFRIEYERGVWVREVFYFVREAQALGAERLARLAPGQPAEVRAAAISELLSFVASQPENRRPELASELAETLVAIAEDAGESFAVRNAAVGALGYLDVPEVLQRLAEIPRRETGVVAAEVVRTLEKMVDPRTDEMLLELVGAADPEVRAAAISALAHRRSEASLPAIVRVLETASDSGVQLAALEAIQTLGHDPKAAARWVIALLERRPADPRVRRQALSLLGSLGRTQGYATVLRHLDEREEEAVQAAAAYALAGVEIPGRWRRQRAEAVLLVALGRGQAVRLAAAVALGRMEAGSAVDPLIDFILDPQQSSEVRAASAIALGSIGDRTATAPLMLLLFEDEANRQVRRTASQALGELGDPSALDKLVSVSFEDEDPYVRAAAQEAVRQIKEAPAEQWLALELQAAGNPVLRAELLRKAASSETPEAVALLITALEDEDFGVRDTAASELARLPDALTFEALAAAVEGDVPARREGAVRVLGAKVGSDRALELLLGRVDDPDPDVRRAIVSGLGWADDDRARQALLTLEHGEKNPRILQALGRSLADQGVLLIQGGDLDAARSFADRALAVREETLGRQHPDVADSLSLLARIDRHQGDLDEAEDRLERALAITERTRGPSHLETAYVLGQLARVLDAKGEDRGAEAAHLQMLAILERGLAPGDDQILTALEDLATFYDNNGDKEAAERFRTRAEYLREVAKKDAAE